MNRITQNPKIIIGLVYLIIISITLYFLFSIVDIKDLISFEFIKSNKDIILKYKEKNFLFLALSFFIFSVAWVLLLGFATPLLIFSGFVFGKWWGILIVLTSTTIGATLLYMLAGFFFKDIIKNYLSPKFSHIKISFSKNDILYFMSFRFIGGGGAPYAIQNIIPILFDMPVKKYFLATILGCMPSMFVTVSLASGIENIIDKNLEFSFSTVMMSPEIYIPLIGFFIILTLAFVIRKFYFK